MAKSSDDVLKKFMNPREIIFYQATMHGTAYVFPLLMLVLGLVLTFMPELIIQNAGPMSKLAEEVMGGVGEVLFGLVIILMAMLVALQIYMQKKNNRNVVTNQRVISMEGTFTHKINDFYLHKIDKIKTKQTIFDRMLSRGRVEIRDVYWAKNKEDLEKHRIVLTSVADPKKFKDSIEMAIERYGGRAKEMQKKNKRKQKFSGN